jgi:hypothetical protein
MSALHGQGTIGVPVDVPCLSLDRFIKAYSNPVIVTDKAQLEQQLQDRGVPRRLVLDFAFLEPEFVAECLADGILFSTERGCWRLS